MCEKFCQNLLNNIVQCCANFSRREEIPGAEYSDNSEGIDETQDIRDVSRSVMKNHDRQETYQTDRSKFYHRTGIGSFTNRLRETELTIAEKGTITKLSVCGNRHQLRLNHNSGIFDSTSLNTEAEHTEFGDPSITDNTRSALRNWIFQSLRKHLRFNTEVEVLDVPEKNTDSETLNQRTPINFRRRETTRKSVSEEKPESFSKKINSPMKSVEMSNNENHWNKMDQTKEINCNRSNHEKFQHKVYRKKSEKSNVLPVKSRSNEQSNVISQPKGKSVNNSLGPVCSKAPRKSIRVKTTKFFLADKKCERKPKTKRM